MANVIEIVIKQTGQGSAITDASKALGSFKGAGDTAISTLVGVGKALTGVGAIAATALIGFGASGVKAAMDVDHQLAQIAATLGTTKDAAMPLKDLMTELALDPKLTVNVTQAGEAIEVLAANGLELQDILEGGARGAVQLANATGSDFATAATIATDAMQQFGFEANELGQVADGIAGVLVKSKFSADDYALALSNAGGIAGSLGVELSDFNTVLAATSSQFASGSDAGTSFKTLLARLAKPTDEVAAAMQQYGLSIFDAEGKMKPFAEIAGQLNKIFNESFTVTTQVGGATKEQAKAAEQASKNIGDLTRDIGLNKDKLQLLNDELALQIQYYGDGSPKVRDKRIAIERLTNSITDQEEKLAEYNAAINAVSGAQARTVTSTQKLTEAQKAELATTLGGTDAMRTILGLAGMTEEQFSTLSEEVNKSGLASQAAATRVDSLTGAWEIFKGIVEAVQIQVGDKFLPVIRQVTEAVSVWASENSASVVNFFGQIAAGIEMVIAKGTELFNAFQEGGANGLMVALGLSPEQIAMIESGVKLIMDNLEVFKGALIGIGAVVGVGIFVSLGAAIASLLTPINLLIVGAGLLGAAWAGNWGNIQGITQQTVAVLTTVFNTLSTIAMSLVSTISENVWPQLQEAFNNITLALNNMGLNWGDVWNALVTATTVVASVLGIAILGIIGTVTGLVTGFASAFATITSYFTDFQNAIGLFINGVTTMFTGMVTITAGLITGDLSMIFEGLRQTVQGTFDTIAGFGDFVLTALQASLGAIFSFVRGWMASFTAFFDGIAPALGEKFEAAWESVREVWKPDKWFELGESVITGILEGIKKNQAEVLEMLKELAKDAIKAAKEAIGFGSPATEFMPIGESMVQGMLLGARRENFAKRFIDDLNMGGFARAAGTGGGQWRNFRNILKNEIGASFEQLMTSGMSAVEIMDKIKAVAHRFNFPPSFATEFAAANGLIEHLTNSVTEFQTAMRIENMGRMLQMGSQLSGIAGNFAGMLKETSSGQMDALKAFLESGGQTFRMFKELEGGGTSEFFWDRNRAQREYNLLLEQQEHQQDLINQQLEQQQKLSFLQSQLDLIKLGRELGGNLFEGITFGLNASVEDLLAATNAVTEAMINQINADLQIASPSKVLFRMFRDQVGGAMAGGLMAARPMLQGIISPVLSPIMEGASAVGRVVNNSFSMTVNTAATESSVIGDFRTMQLMAGS